MRVLGHLVILRLCLIDKFHDDVVADAVNVSIEPLLERVGSSFLATGSMVAPARRMVFNLVRRPKGDVNSAAVGLPAGSVRGCESPVGISNPPVVFQSNFPDRARVRSAAQP